MTLKIAISGAAGRMGREITRAVGRAQDMSIDAAFESVKSTELEKDVGVVSGGEAVGVKIESGPTISGAVNFDVWLEFTTPQATLQNLQVCRALRRPMVIGTTGIDEEGRAEIVEAAKEIPIVFAANTSIGINLCLALLQTAGKVLAASDGAGMDVEVVEAHHRDKVDAPSGTALLLGDAIAGEMGVDVEKDGVFARHGNTGARKAGSIGFSTIRGGDIAGEHTVLLIGDGERVEITHRATNRRIFADGAITAARWVARQGAGLYTMSDVLGLGDSA